MTLKEVERELKEIYEERKKWDGGKGPFTSDEIKRRELILIKQGFLYQLEEAIKGKDKNKKEFLLEILEIINKWLKILKEAKNVEI
ncbi:MAG: hypothetical protein ABIK77_05140 [candidate division WOR-3 bacterium]